MKVRKEIGDKKNIYYKKDEKIYTHVVKMF